MIILQKVRAAGKSHEIAEQLKINNNIIVVQPSLRARDFF